MAIVTSNPVKLKYNFGPGVNTMNKVFGTSDNLPFVLVPLLSGVKDVSFNQDTLSILTSNSTLANSLSSTLYNNKTNFIIISTIKAGNFYITGASIEDTYLTKTADITKALGFTFTFNNEFNKVNISYNGFYLTNDGTAILKLKTGTPGTTYFNNNQTFYYNLYDNKISLFSSAKKVIAFKTLPQLQLKIFTSFAEDDNILVLERFTGLYINTVGDSNNIKYNSISNDININLTTSTLPYNYLLFTPYTTVSGNELNYNITPLKNYYSAENLQTPTLSTQLRDYNKLYTGLNSETGNEKIYLSYKNSETIKIFAKDADTYFHFPVSATNIALSASTLVKSGARGGSSPWRSDRIFVKRADYKNYSNWGDFKGLEDGTYFCSWLSASEIGKEPVWMDRYYNSKRVNITQVLASSGVGISNNNFPNVIWDIPSTQAFSNECLYVYHRIGDNDNIAVVEALSSSLTHYIKNWTSPLINNVDGASAGYIKPALATNSITLYPLTRDYALNTDINYASLAINNEDFYTPGFTLCFQAYNNDWSKFTGDQIVGNFYNGGIGLFKNNPLLTPFISIVGDTLTTFNTNLEKINNPTTVTYLSGNSFILKGKYEESFFVLDVFKNVYEYDQDGTVINKFTIPHSGVLRNAILYQDTNNIRMIYVGLKNGNNLNCYTYDVSGTQINSQTGTNKDNFALDLNGNTTFYTGDGNSTVDNNGKIFVLDGDIIIKDFGNPLNHTNTQLVSALSAKYIACDHLNNIWVLYSRGSICKLDNYGTVLWDVDLTSDPVVAGGDLLPRTISFIAELDPNTNLLSYYGLITDSRTQNIFKVEPLSGTIVAKYKTTTDIFTGPKECRVLGDATGYDYQRRTVYYRDDKKSKIKVKALFNNISSPVNSSFVKEFTYSTSNLVPGWHHFAVSLDTNNMFKFYIDGLPALSAQIGTVDNLFRVYNRRNNPNMLIGTSSFKTQTLAEYTKTTSNIYNFNGSIADVRFYSEALSLADIKAVDRRFHTDVYTDLTWICPAGTRYYIEQIDRFFPHRLPGAKSHLFNIKIKNSNITNENLRSIIEKNIIATLSKTTPVHTKLNRIIWE